MTPMPLPELMARMDRATAAHAEEQVTHDPQARLSQLRQALAVEGTMVSETALTAALRDEPAGPRPMTSSLENPTPLGVVLLGLVIGLGFSWLALVGEAKLFRSAPTVVPPPASSMAAVEQLRAQQVLLALRAQMNLMQGDLNMGPNPSPAEQRRRLTQHTALALAQGYAEAMTSSSSSTSRSHP